MPIRVPIENGNPIPCRYFSAQQKYFAFFLQKEKKRNKVKQKKKKAEKIVIFKTFIVNLMFIG